MKIDEIAINLSKNSERLLDFKSIMKNKKIVSAITRKNEIITLLESKPQRDIFSANPLKKETTENSVQVYPNGYLQSQSHFSPEKIYKYSQYKVVSLKSMRFANKFNPSKSLLSTISNNKNIQTLNNVDENKNYFNNVNTIPNIETTNININSPYRVLLSNHNEKVSVINSPYPALLSNHSEKFSVLSTIKDSFIDFKRRPVSTAFSTQKKYVNYMTKSEQFASQKEIKYKNTIQRFQEDNKHLYLRFKYFNSKSKNEVADLCSNKKYQGLDTVEYKQSRVKLDCKKQRNTCHNNRPLSSYKSSQDIIKLKYN